MRICMYKNKPIMKYDIEVADLVKIKEEYYNTYAKDVICNENAFRILSISKDCATLSDINGEVPLSAIEPIPINGKDDACIYYDPMIAADIIEEGTPVKCRNRNTSYYVDGFATMHIGDRTLQDEFLEKGFAFVHEVQHWLREDSSWEELKINQTIKQ